MIRGFIEGTCLFSSVFLPRCSLNPHTFDMPVGKFAEYGLLTKPCWVKVLASFPFFAYSETSTMSLSINNEKKNKVNVLGCHLDRASWVNKGFFI